MQALWTRYKQWLEQHWPEALAALNPPASDEDIARMEQVLGAPLPADYIASLKIHNGERAGPAFGLFRGDEYLPVDSVLSNWACWKELCDKGVFDENSSDGGSTVSSLWWHTGWIPFSHDGSGNFLCVDTAPGRDGAGGQIIQMWHDDDGRPVVAADFGSWFSEYVDGLYTGKYVRSLTYGILESKTLARLEAPR